MAKPISTLSVLEIEKSLTPKEKEYKKTDGGGLYLLITPSGGKLWRFNYRFDGKHKTLFLGKYPDVTLENARKQRTAVRELLANGVDPGAVKKSQKIQEQIQNELDANTFEKVARDWHQHNKPDWSDNHADRLLRRLELDIFPYIGNKPIVEIERPEIIELLHRVAVRTLETAHRLKIAFHGVFRYAHNKGLIKHNPSADMRGVLPTVKPKHMAAPTEPKKVAELVKAIDGFTGSYVTKCALQLTAMLFVRPGELRSMEWSELDLDAAEWNIPGHKMKMKNPHLVPLSMQAVDILKELHHLTGTGKYVFPCHRSPLRCMSENTVNASLRRLGFEKDEICAHGFRAMARTLLHEVLNIQPDVIEAQLAHIVPDRLGRAYNRTQFIAERRRIMQVWSDYLDGLKRGAKVLPFKAKAA